MLFNQTHRATTAVALILVDLCAYYTALGSSYGLRKGLDMFLLSHVHTRFSLAHFLSMPLPPLIIICIFIYRGLYEKRMAFWDETLELLKVLLFSVLIIMTVIAMGKLTDEVSRLLIIIMSLVSAVVFPLYRMLGKSLLHKLGIWNERVLVIGAGVTGRDFARGISREKHMGYTVVGFLDDDPRKQSRHIEIDAARLPVLGRLSKCPELIAPLRLHTLAVAIPSLDVDAQAVLVNNLQAHMRRLLFVPEIRGVALANTNLYHLFDEELFILRINNNLKSAVNRFYKAVFDYALTLATLPLLLAALTVTAVMIRWDSPGPAIFVQKRLGRNGRKFNCYKFRTMHQDNERILEEALKDEKIRREWEIYKKIKGNDPRITKVGRFLRRSSLDELPQLLNVLKGDMSLVGPRPYIPHEIDAMQNLDAIILETKPGITGLWQVSGRNSLTFERRLRLDMWYVRNWSLWVDIVMILKTVKAVLKGDGAY